METVNRVTVIYIVIVAGLRVMGKREFGQLSPAELVTLLIIPEIVSQALIREDYSLVNAIVGTATLFSLVFLTSVVMQYIKPMEKVISSPPTLLVHGGKFLEDNMNKERITPDEIYSELHKAGLYDLSQVRWVILEPDGKLSVISNQEPPQRHPRAEDTSILAG